MIRQITDSAEAREFLNSVPFDEYVPEGFPVCNPLTLILGWYETELLACWPCFIKGDELEMHACCSSEFRGKRAVHACKNAIEWIFSNTPFETVVVYPKIKHGTAYAYMCGFRRNGDRLEVMKWADS